MGIETTGGIGRLELIRIAESVAQEKGIDVDDVLIAMEQAIQTAARRKYGLEHQIVAEVDRKTGEISLYRQLEVADENEMEDPVNQIPLEDAREKKPGGGDRRPYSGAAGRRSTSGASPRRAPSR